MEVERTHHAAPTSLPTTKHFGEVFGLAAEAAERVEAGELIRAWSSTHSFPDHEGLRTSWLGDITFLDMRINDDSGDFIGVLRRATPDARTARWRAWVGGSRNARADGCSHDPEAATGKHVRGP